MIFSKSLDTVLCKYLIFKAFIFGMKLAYKENKYRIEFKGTIMEAYPFIKQGRQPIGQKGEREWKLIFCPDWKEKTAVMCEWDERDCHEMR